MILLLLLSVVAASFKVRSERSSFEKHLSLAESFEKSGQLEKALKEYEAAAKFALRATPSEKRKLQKKIELLKKEIRVKEDEDQQTTPSSKGSSETTQTTTTGSVLSGPDVVKVENLGLLLPEKFNDLSGTVVSAKDVASVRFDDVGSKSSYFVYVYRHTNKKSAGSFLNLAKAKLFPLNQSEVVVEGAYSGINGFYGENDQGDSALYFGYGNLVFELLLRSETLKIDKRKEILLSLAKELKKP
jgi:hypothetical protein